jgi:hypothetical protein
MFMKQNNSSKESHNKKYNFKITMVHKKISVWDLLNWSSWTRDIKVYVFKFQTVALILTFECSNINRFFKHYKKSVI